MPAGSSGLILGGQPVGVDDFLNGNVAIMFRDDECIASVCTGMVTENVNTHVSH